MKSFITSIGIANPAFCFPQLKIAEFMADAVNMNQEERSRLFSLYKATGIEQRYTVLKDFGSCNGDHTFFPNTKDLEPLPPISKRMMLYEQEALKLALKAIESCMQHSDCQPEEITHLITVSCTGMYAPGLDLEIVERLGLKTQTQRTCINYMGCYAAFNAIKVADAICKSDANAKVLVVCVELCTIHYQKSKNWDHILSNALFADGAAALLMEPQPGNKVSLGVDSFYCDVIFEGKKDMAWHISDFGFEMTLSSYVPSMVFGGIENLTQRVLNKANLTLEEIDYLAIHPGGKKIVQAVEEALHIDKNKTKVSYDVLRAYGNMSSPTILFVLYKLIQQFTIEDQDKKLLGFAFGPGLTIESMLLNIIVKDNSMAQISEKDALFIKA